MSLSTHSVQHISKGLLVTMALLTTHTGAAPATAPAQSSAQTSCAWSPKPGRPAHPAIAPSFWATNGFADFYTQRKHWDDAGVMGFVEYDPKLPRVLLIGDSISMGYTLDVRQMFKGQANVYRIHGNGGDMTRFLANYARYLGAGTNWDLIHFNWGLHDLVRQDATKAYNSSAKPRFTEAEYVQHLEQCVAILKATGAHLVWASTTPVPPNSAGRVTGDEVVRNARAAAVMQKEGIAIDDLYTLMKNGENFHAGPGNVHFTGAGYLVLAKQIARVIEKQLGITAKAVATNGPAARLVNHWRFNNSFRDELTKLDSRPAAAQAFAFVPGQLSPCLQVKNSGANKSLNLGTQAGALKSFSVTLWFKAEKFERPMTLIGKTGTGTNNVGWQISLRRPAKTEGECTAGGIWFMIGNPALRKTQNLRYDRPAFTVGKWHHLACTFDGASGTAEMFVDGAMLTRSSGLSPNAQDVASELKLSDSHYGFNGCLDELQIWDGPLTGSQVKELANQEGG
jgi:acyl-CoA thioesterase-1